MMSSNQPAVAPPAQADPCPEHAREELCGKHIGDRRVRVPRQQQTRVRKIAAAVRRTLNR